MLCVFVYYVIDLLLCVVFVAFLIHSELVELLPWPGHL